MLYPVQTQPNGICVDAPLMFLDLYFIFIFSFLI